MGLVDVNEDGRLSQLIALRQKLAFAIDECESKRDLAALSRSYRETIKEIEEIEGNEPEEDEIAKLLGESNGVPGPVRKNNTEL